MRTWKLVTVSGCYYGNPQPLTTKIGKQSLIKAIHVLVSCNPNFQILSHNDLCLKSQGWGDDGMRVERGDDSH